MLKTFAGWTGTKRIIEMKKVWNRFFKYDIHPVRNLLENGKLLVAVNFQGNFTFAFIKSRV